VFSLNASNHFVREGIFIYFPSSDGGFPQEKLHHHQTGLRTTRPVSFLPAAGITFPRSSQCICFYCRLYFLQLILTSKYVFEVNIAQRGSGSPFFRTSGSSRVPPKRLYTETFSERFFQNVMKARLIKGTPTTQLTPLQKVLGTTLSVGFMVEPSVSGGTFIKGSHRNQPADLLPRPVLSTSFCFIDCRGLDRGPCLPPTIHTLCHTH